MHEWLTPPLADDLRAYRLFPTRFKVLAQLGKFDPARLKADFDAFCTLCDPVTGWLFPYLMAMMLNSPSFALR